MHRFTSLALALALMLSPLRGEATNDERPRRIDLHLHVTLREASKLLVQGEPGKSPLADSPSSRFVNTIDEDGLREAGIEVALAAVWPLPALRPGRSSLDEALVQLQALHRFDARKTGFAVAFSALEAEQHAREGKIALIASVEGGEGIRRVEDLDLYFAAGARVLTLVHFTDNDLGGAAPGQLGFIFGLGGGLDEGRGLSALGKAVVLRMVRLGMVVDLAHASDRTSSDVLDLLEPLGVPVLYSHGASRVLRPLSRNLDDPLATRILRLGGMLGVIAYEKYLSPVPERARWDGFVPDTCDALVAHWQHFAQLQDAEAIALGSDMNSPITRPGAGGLCPNGLRSSKDLVTIYSALSTRGVSASALDRSALRFYELLRVVESRADPSARAEAIKRFRPSPSSPSDFP